MLIATKLKKENICEYLLYMWQIEDILRACKLDIELVDKHIISKFPVKDEAERKAVYEWYESLIEMMRLENVQEKGHLQINSNVIIDLNDFHSQVMKSSEVPAYHAKYYHILPFINQFRAKSNPGLSDIELCFNFMYGFMLLKMKGAEIKPETIQLQTEIGKYMALMAKYYHRYKNGELDLEV